MVHFRVLAVLLGAAGCETPRAIGRRCARPSEWASPFSRLARGSAAVVVPRDMRDAGFVGVTSITIGAGYLCALIDGGVWCAGDDSAGTMGRGTSTRVEAGGWVVFP